MVDIKAKNILSTAAVFYILCSEIAQPTFRLEIGRCLKKPPIDKLQNPYCHYCLKPISRVLFCASVNDLIIFMSCSHIKYNIISYASSLNVDRSDTLEIID